MSYDLPVLLGMVRRGEDVVDIKYFRNVLKGLGSEESSFVGDNFLRSSVVKEPLIHEMLGHFGYRQPLYRYCIIELGKPVWYYQDELVTSCGIDQSAQDVDGNGF